MKYRVQTKGGFLGAAVGPELMDSGLGGGARTVGFKPRGWDLNLVIQVSGGNSHGESELLEGLEHRGSSPEVAAKGQPKKDPSRHQLPFGGITVSSHGTRESQQGPYQRRQ